MYQPSTAGYGERPSASASNLGTPDAKGLYNSRSTLLDGASPMGRASFADTSNVSTPDLSSAFIQPREYFTGPSNSSSAGRPPGQHHRHASSGVGLPGPTSAVRRGPSDQHSPMLTGLSFSDAIGAPDGVSFRPGQYVNHVANTIHGVSVPQAPQRTPRPQVGVARSNSRTLRGPPPARSNSKRKSRYSQMPRVESVGAGLARQSRFMDEAEGSWDGQSTGINHGSRDHQYMAQFGSRSSVYASERGRSAYGAGRMSVYGAGLAETEAMQRAQAEGFGSGTPVAGPTIMHGGLPGSSGSLFDPLGAQPSLSEAAEQPNGAQRRPTGVPQLSQPLQAQCAQQAPQCVPHPPSHSQLPRGTASSLASNVRAAYGPGPFPPPMAASRQPQLAGVLSESGSRQLL